MFEKNSIYLRAPTHYAVSRNADAVVLAVKVYGAISRVAYSRNPIQNVLKSYPEEVVAIYNIYSLYEGKKQNLYRNP